MAPSSPVDHDTASLLDLIASDDPRHGSPRGYKAHKTRDEDPCEPCRDAWKAYLRERREAA